MSLLCKIIVLHNSPPRSREPLSDWCLLGRFVPSFIDSGGTVSSECGLYFLFKWKVLTLFECRILEETKKSQMHLIVSDLSFALDICNERSLLQSERERMRRHIYYFRRGSFSFTPSKAAFLAALTAASVALRV